jgi:hypothetical protein
MGALIPEGKVNKDQSEVIQRFQEMIDQGSIKSFIICGIDKEGRSVVAQHIDSVIEGFGILKTAELAISSMAMENYEEDDCECNG